MVTNNFKQFLKTLLTTFGNSTANHPSVVPAMNTSGIPVYLACKIINNSTFPSQVSTTVQKDGFAGIWIGSGTTPATQTDFTLENKISTGFSALTSSVQITYDDDNNPVKRITIIITNTTSEAITVSEIGYVQALPGNSIFGSNVTSATVLCLLDRTLLDEPVTIPAGSSAAINYTLKTII